MGKDVDSKRGRHKKGADTSSPSSSSSSDSESPERKRKSRRSSSHREHSRHRSRHHSREDRSSGESKKRNTRTRDKEEKKRKHRHRSLSDSGSNLTRDHSSSPESIVQLILKRYPDVASDLSQLLQMVDSGQGVDISGIPNSDLVKLLKKLFKSLKLKQNDRGVFVLQPKSIPTSETIGSGLCSYPEPRENLPTKSELPNEKQSPVSDPQNIINKYDTNDATQSTEAFVSSESSAPPKRRFLGPQMPSRELLDAAAKLTEAETLLREAEFDVDDDIIIGPPPPAMVAEAESANEAERFEEVARIAAAEVDKPYDILGVNWKTPADNIKKKYWKLSLMVHPDKCSHPQAHQAFVKLNQAFKELQDTDKKQALDEKIRYKEEQEQFQAELKSFREAAQWRQLQGISIEGDDELLEMTKEAPKRDEWMTALPPERKPGMTMQSSTFSKRTKEGRGDTSIWTDNPLDKAEKAKQTYLEANNPLDKAEKAKQTYLEAYKNTVALADTDYSMKSASTDAGVADSYKSAKRSVSLVHKHQEKTSRPKKMTKPREKEEWAGVHPWKPWDREKDLTAGRKDIKLDSENMAQGLSSRFSSGS